MSFNPMDKPRLDVAVGVVKNPQGQVLIAQRATDAPQGGLWEFPGGKLEAGETAEQALIRELAEELAITVQQTRPLIRLKHDYPNLDVQLWVFEVTAFSGEPQGNEGQPLQWVATDQLAEWPFPAANRAIVKAIQLPSFYALLDSTDAGDLPRQLQTALTKGATLLQIRAKTLSAKQIQDFLDAAAPLCARHGAYLLANSASAVSEHPALSGLHLTSTDLLLTQQRPGQVRWLGASCHNPEELRHAHAIGADFAVLAPVLPTLSHPGVAGLGWDCFAEWVADCPLPVYALGGMTLAMLDTAKANGAQGIAAIRAFWD